MSLKGLGRGLDALLASDSASARDSQILTVAIDSLVPNQEQPRKTMTKEGLEELSNSIRNQGIIQPLLVRPLPGRTGRYQIIAGERRWRAATMAGLREVPVYKRELTDNDVMLIARMVILQREDLNPADEALA
ncbi:MAG: ParB/RepB/Spo0J family partition protein, partial [Desulfovibrionaceae bacterium]|nr:ParB/RepB/Spo0J family partition protein [Desulfovibrionaceae bacterium]